MRISTRPQAILVTAGALLSMACSDGEPEGAGLPSGDAGPPAAGGAEMVEAPAADTGSASATRVALPGLYSIMAALQADMARVSRGLWLEDLDTVAAGADAVANHPQVPPEEFQRISEVLGEEMSRFGGMDMEVHDVAVRLGDAADRADLESVLALDAELRRACVRCHSTYRQRLRAEIR